MILHPRQEWQTASQPVTGPKPDYSKIVDHVIHYPGSPAGTTYNNPAQTLRNMQNSYLNDPDRGYSLGYSYVIDPKGEVWEVRGMDIKQAATRGYNDYSWATMFLVGGTASANSAQVNAFVELHRMMNAKIKRSLGIYGHGQKGTTPTPCPGAGIYSQIPMLRNLVNVEPQPPIPPPPTPIPIPDTGDEPMQCFIRPAGSAAIFACFNGFKVWMVDHDTYLMRVNLNVLNGQDKLNQMIDNADANVMEATYPILGPIPSGHNAWGSVA